MRPVLSHEGHYYRKLRVPIPCIGYRRLPNFFRPAFDLHVPLKGTTTQSYRNMKLSTQGLRGGWLTLKNHSLFDTLLKPAILATVPLSFGYLAVSVRHTGVHASVLHRALEEAFTSKTAQPDRWKKGFSPTAANTTLFDRGQKIMARQWKFRLYISWISKRGIFKKDMGTNSTIHQNYSTTPISWLLSSVREIAYQYELE